MKKVLFCAGILALAVSCTNELDTLPGQEVGKVEGTKSGKGISFGASISVAPSTRADMSFNPKGNEGKGAHEFFWYAEQDRVNIWSLNAKSDKFAKTYLEDWKKMDGTAFGSSIYAGFENEYTYSATDPQDNVTSGVYGDYITQIEVDHSNPADRKTEIEKLEGAFRDWALEEFPNTDFYEKAFVTYKATQSATKGWFTSIDDDNMLGFPDDSDDENTSRFFMFYPSKDIDVEISAPDPTTGQTIWVKELPLLADQKQLKNDNSNIAKSVFMFSDSEGYAEKSYNSVGEKLNIEFIRPFTAVVYNTEGHEEEFGDLAKVTLTAKGYGEAGKTGYIAPSILDYGDAGWLYNFEDGKYELVYDDNGTPTPIVVTKGTNPAAATAENWANKVNDASSEIVLDSYIDKWTDKSFAYMAINYLGREAFGKTTPETMEVKFEFANLEPLTTPIVTSNSWPAKQGNNQFMNIKLKFSEFPYLVTKKNNNVRSLFIYKNLAFDDIFTKDGNDDVFVKWGDDEIALDEFVKIKVANDEAVLEDDVLAELKGFENVTHIKLGGNTHIPAETFKDLANLTEINLPAVETFVADAFDGTTLSKVIMPAFDFTNQPFSNTLLNEDYLRYLDMSGASQIGGTSWLDTNFKLEDYKKLVTVVVQDGLKVGSDAFKGCSVLLDVVTGFTEENDRIFASVELLGASTFEKCVALDTIGVVGTSIPNAAFKGCANLAGISSEIAKRTQIEPIEVGISAFEGCGKLEYMSLAKATVIEEAAFRGCSILIGGKDKSTGSVRDLLVIGASTVNKNAFENCQKLRYVEFTNKVAFYTEIFKGADLKQVKFNDIFTYPAATYSSATFGNNTSTKVDMFKHKDQTGFTGTRLALTGVADGGIAFKTVSSNK